MKKEVVRQALRHRKPGSVPSYFGLTQGAREALKAHYGDSLDQHLGNYLSVYYLDRPQPARRCPCPRTCPRERPTCPGLSPLAPIVKEKGTCLSIHSCRKVQELFPSLVELGVDLFNPFQPEVMDVASLYRHYNGRLSFWGGLSVQHTLPMGSPADVRREVIELWNMGRGGSYVLSPSHDITADVPVENLVALVETVKELDRL